MVSGARSKVAKSLRSNWCPSAPRHPVVAPSPPPRHGRRPPPKCRVRLRPPGPGRPDPSPRRSSSDAGPSPSLAPVPAADHLPFLALERNLLFFRVHGGGQGRGGGGFRDGVEVFEEGEPRGDEEKEFLLLLLLLNEFLIKTKGDFNLLNRPNKVKISR